MKVRLPMGLEIDLDNIPEDFEKVIQDSFADYTEGTNPDYMFIDKLNFIDNCVKYLRNAKDEEDAVMELIHDQVDYALENEGRLPDDDEVISIEGMQESYRRGREAAKLSAPYYRKSSREDQKITKLLVRVIKAVMKYEKEDM